MISRETLYIDVRDRYIDSSLPYDIRRAHKLGVNVATEPTRERVEAFYAIYAQNCRDKGWPQKPRATVEALLDDGLREGHATISFALHLLILWSPAKQATTSLTPREARSQQSGTLLIQRALEIAAERHVRFWSRQASPSRDSGVYRFKKKWGSTSGAFRVYVLPFQTAEAVRALGR